MEDPIRVRDGTKSGVSHRGRNVTLVVRRIRVVQLDQFVILWLSLSQAGDRRMCEKRVLTSCLYLVLRCAVGEVEDLVWGRARAMRKREGVF